MISPPAGVRIMVSSCPVDFRNGLDGLAALVQQALRENPFAGDLFVFRAKRADRAGLGRHGSVPVPQAPGERPLRLAARAGRGDSPECSATGAIAGGTGLVPGPCEVGNSAIIGGVMGQFPHRPMTASIISACSSTPPSLCKIQSSSRRGSLP